MASEPVRAQSVERRGGEPTLYGQITELDAGGVTIRSDLGADHFVPWDRVRAVNDPPRSHEIERWAATATMLWRARSRIERNDATLAEPLFERLFEQYRGHTHETALVVAEGLLRCRLARGANALAIIPALEVMRIRRADVTTRSYTQLPDILDDEYALCTMLAPYWLDSPLLDRVYEEVANYNAYGDDVVAAIARLYAESLRHRVHPQAAPLIDEAGFDALPDHPGIELLTNLLRLRSTDPGVRTGVRNRLLAQGERQPAFVQAWVRFFVGWSLLGESGVVRRERGMMNLLHLPALWADEQKYLTGVALRLAAVTLEEMGHVDAADRLTLELASQFPNHPVRTLQAGELGLPLS